MNYSAHLYNNNDIIVQSIHSAITGFFVVYTCLFETKNCEKYHFFALIRKQLDE